ncbi:MAG: winged helix-turn-helix domain-containing protein [Thermoguttaceae bacterium]
MDVQIVGLRKKLGDAGTYIETVRGVGYRFKE